MTLLGDRRGQFFDFLGDTENKSEYRKKGNLTKTANNHSGWSITLEHLLIQRQENEPDIKRREPLELYLFQKTKTPQQRQHNKETMRLAEAIKAKRLLESQSGKHGLDHYPQTFTCISWNS